MFNKKMVLGTFAGVAALGLSSAVLAGGGGYVAPAPMDSGAGWYIGGKIGYGRNNWDSIFSNTVGLTTTTGQSGFGASIDLGYAFNRIFAIQGDAVYLPSAKVLVGPTGSGTFGFATGTQIFKINNYAFDLVGKISAPVSDIWGFFADAGVGFLKSNGISTVVGTVTGNTSNTNLTYGFGAYYNWTQNVSLNLGMQRWNGNQNISRPQPYMDLYSVGIDYRFADTAMI